LEKHYADTGHWTELGIYPSLQLCHCRLYIMLMLKTFLSTGDRYIRQKAPELKNGWSPTLH
jgi:hypothetical protein